MVLQNRSTIDQLVRLETFIRGDAFVNKEHAVSLFFLFRKSIIFFYDTTWKYGILKDFHNIGLKGHFPNFIKFIRNFLGNKNFNIGLRLVSTISDNFEQEMGVPQESSVNIMGKTR